MAAGDFYENVPIGLVEFLKPRTDWQQIRQQEEMNMMYLAQTAQLQQNQLQQQQLQNQELQEAFKAFHNQAFDAPDQERLKSVAEEFRKTIADKVKNQYGNDYAKFLAREGKSAVNLAQNMLLGSEAYRNGYQNKLLKGAITKDVTEGKVPRSIQYKVRDGKGGYVDKIGTIQDQLNDYNLGLVDQLQYSGAYKPSNTWSDYFRQVTAPGKEFGNYDKKTNSFSPIAITAEDAVDAMIREGMSRSDAIDFLRQNPGATNGVYWKQNDWRQENREQKRLDLSIRADRRAGRAEQRAERALQLREQATTKGQQDYASILRATLQNEANVAGSYNVRRRESLLPGMAPAEGGSASISRPNSNAQPDGYFLNAGTFKDGFTDFFNVNDKKASPVNLRTLNNARTVTDSEPLTDLLGSLQGAQWVPNSFGSQIIAQKSDVKGGDAGYYFTAQIAVPSSAFNNKAFADRFKDSTTEISRNKDVSVKDENDNISGYRQVSAEKMRIIDIKIPVDFQNEALIRSLNKGVTKNDRAYLNDPYGLSGADDGLDF